MIGGVLEAAGAIGGVVGGVSDLFGGGGGGDSASTEGIRFVDIAPASGQEKAIQDRTNKQIKTLQGQQNQAAGQSAQDAARLNSAFRNILLKAVTGTSNPSPAQLQAATQFVDQTFTAPAQRQFEQFQSDFSGQQQQRAAALGRQSDDFGYQKELAQTFGKTAGDLAAQRGQLIAQRADELSYARPLQAGLAGGQFFNNLAQQAFNNQLNLLNQATIQQQLGQQERIAGATTRQSGNVSQVAPQASLGSQLAGIGGSLGNLGTAVKPLYNNLFGSGDSSSSNPFSASLGSYTGTPQYTLASNYTPPQGLY